MNKSNPDYSASAVMLTNPGKVMVQYAILKVQQTKMAYLQGQAEASIPQELRDEIFETQKLIETKNKELREAIDELGSYQNVEAGEYAVKQMRKTVNYEPALARDNLDPKCAAMVIVESVDKVALNRLVKAQMVTQEEADLCGIAKIDYAYIIR